MKKQNKKLITFLLAGAMCCTAAIGVANLQSFGAFADGETTSTSQSTQYLLTDLFNSAAVVGGTEVNGVQATTFAIHTDRTAYYRNAVALKWHEGKKVGGAYAASYYTLTFALADANFNSVSVKTESASSIASEEGKAVNEVKFTKTASTENDVTVDISVIADGAEAVTVRTGYKVAFGDKITLTLTESDICEYTDQFEVLLQDKNGAAINTTRSVFKNVGANYAAYSTDSSNTTYPLQFTADTNRTAEGDAYEETKIYLFELNNQKFDNVSEGKITDTAPPVLVVNEDVNGFMLGSAFSLNYEVIDVAKKTLTTDEKKLSYYQYNPTDEEVKYNSLSTSTYFMETYYTEGETLKSVYQENGNEEFVSVRFTLADSTFKADEGDNAKAVYDLVWYANDGAIRTKDNNEYVVINRSQSGAIYAKGSGAYDAYVIADGGVNKYLTVDSAGNKSYVSEEETGAYMQSELKKFVDSYNELLAKAAADVYAGSNATIVFPTFEGLFYDDNGYRNLKFSICYKTETGSAQTSTGLKYSALKLSASTAGKYEFKIFATDDANNAMKYYLDGELVEVTTSNIWDIEAIPTFEYTIKRQGLKIKDENSTKTSDRTATKAVGETYSVSGITVVGGADNQQSEFSLYRVDLAACVKNGVNAGSLAKVTYQDIRLAAADKLVEVKDSDVYHGDYLAMYFDVYLDKLSDRLGIAKSKLKECFVEVKAYNDRITEDDKEWDEYNKYEFQKSSKSGFKVVDDGGVYLLLANYWDEDLANYARVAAYKVITAEEKADVARGETQWLKNNLVSVILFSVAAVMLILIIILLLIKPSDETLEDVDEKAEKLAKKVKKTSKK